jgi:hypothetical protein
MYASDTRVSPERSQEQIKNTLRRYGCDKFGVLESTDSVMVMFEVRALQIRMEVKLPPRDEFLEDAAGRKRKAEHVTNAQEKAIRARWRSLFLCIKAKLEAVATGISTIEQEFMPFVVMPDNRVLGEHVIPRLKDMASGGKLPPLLTA